MYMYMYDAGSAHQMSEAARQWAGPGGSQSARAAVNRTEHAVADGLASMCWRARAEATALRLYFISAIGITLR